MRDWARLQKRIGGLLSLTECDYLGGLVRAAGPVNVLEVGHYTGLSSCVILDALPENARFTTVDWHQGDHICGASSGSMYEATVGPYARGKQFTNVFASMFACVDQLDGPFDFVFYDSDHSVDAIARWWALYEPLLADRCTLVFDDADWDDQASLTGLAVDDGFVPVDRPAFFRQSYYDKSHPDTFTLEVLVRS